MPHRRFPRPYRILRGMRVTREVYALRLRDINSREDAERMRGCKVYILDPPKDGSKTPMARDSEEAEEDPLDADYTVWSFRDAMKLVGSRCFQLEGVSDQTLADFAAAETQDEADKILAEAGHTAAPFGKISAVAPDTAFSRRTNFWTKSNRKTAHDMLDITLDSGDAITEDHYLHDKKPSGQAVSSWTRSGEGFDHVVYVPFVPQMIARVHADTSGRTSVYFTMPKGHVQTCSYVVPKRTYNEWGELMLQRPAPVRAVLPPVRQPLDARRRRQLKLERQRSLNGTAPAPGDRTLPQDEEEEEPLEGEFPEHFEPVELSDGSTAGHTEMSRFRNQAV